MRQIWFRVVVAFMLQSFLTVSGYCQRDKSSIEFLLTADDKEWRWTGNSVHMSERCKDSEFLIFRLQPNLVTRKVCDTRKKKYVSTKENWSLSSNNDYDWLIIIGDTTYTLEIIDTKYLQKLILRTHKGFGKTMITNDRIYEFIKPE